MIDIETVFRVDNEIFKVKEDAIKYLCKIYDPSSLQSKIAKIHNRLRELEAKKSKMIIELKSLKKSDFVSKALLVQKRFSIILNILDYKQDIEHTKTKLYQSKKDYYKALAIRQKYGDNNDGSTNK